MWADRRACGDVVLPSRRCHSGCTTNPGLFTGSRPIIMFGSPNSCSSAQVQVSRNFTSVRRGRAPNLDTRVADSGVNFTW